jgi:PAS domain S-box-containing protein
MPKAPLNRKELSYLIACIVITIILIVFQWLTELNTVVAFAAIALVLMTMYIPGKSYTYIFAGVASVLIFVGFYYSRFLDKTIDPSKFSNLFYNRLSGLGSMWITAYLIVKFKISRAEERRSNQRMNALFLYASEGIIITDNQGRIVLVNPEAERQFGYSGSELVSKRIEILIPDRYGRKHVEHRKGYYENPGARYMGRGMELFGVKKDGAEFPVQISLSSFSTEDGMFVVSFILDTTELIKQKELTKALEKEMELNELKSRFVAMASHEFRTPLSTILSSVALVEKYNEPSQQEDKIRHINRIRSTVKNLTNILNDFLSLDKLEDGLVRVNSSSFRLDKFCAEVVEEIRVVAKPGQQINYLYAAKARDVNMDQNLLRNILNNLLNNAIKYSPEKSLIDFTISDTEMDLIITVKDCGMGIPEEDRPFMFDRFFRAKNASNIQGTGLGLNIVKRYIDLMGGAIDFESEQNKGTTFTVKLPLVKE